MKLIFVTWSATLLVITVFKGSLAGTPCNDFVDDVLQKMKTEMDFFQEPYDIPDDEKSFGIYKLEFGHIYGLSTLHRHGDVILQKRGSSRYLKVYLGAGVMSMDCKARNFLNFGKPLDVKAKIAYVTMELDVTAKSDGSKPTISEVKFIEVKGQEVDVKTEGILSGITNLLLKIFMKSLGFFFQNKIKDIVVEKVKSFFKHHVLEISISADCLNSAWK